MTEAQLALQNSRERQPKVLVVGYGNSLRGDDGIGREVARNLAEQRRSQLTVLDIHQLTPELAEELSKVDRAIFIDASVEAKEVTVSTLTPKASSARFGHCFDGAGLLELSRLLYGRAPEAVAIAVPAENFEFGETLSDIARQGGETALEIVEQLLAEAPAIAVLS